ncbi:hypothetical protein Pcinc_018649 [Petrolisthes cinctipes]|uniref:OTU domain-containing protein n=1 Tax=Petrolisthes cinctipes TaxID=88211 RepID=A0AAE1FRN8_PETCI|nr:hypothetical protein Pcinc_018649 [Petrolisthes cinctipes]
MTENASTVARDGSCLFRAVAEQVFMTQTKHVSVRSLCLEYMMLHKEDFQPFLEVPVDHHVFKMQDVREWGGHTEILAMSRLFKVDFLIYQEIGRSPVKATENGFRRIVMMSFTHGNHYDIIYKKEAAITRGFCQSIVYDILYTRVFKLKDVRLAVDTMLHDKDYASLRRDSANSAELKEIGNLVEKILRTNISRDNSQDEADKNASIEERISIEDVHPDDVRGLLSHGVPPFPYKVAKSLDQDLYRNIEYDAWNTVRREARYGPFDSNGFQAGVKVYVKLDLLPDRKEIEDLRRVHIARQGIAENHDGRQVEEKNVYHGHIQEMSENKGPVDVYIEEISVRIKVPYEALEKFPPSPPRSPWHQQGGAGTGGGGGGPGSVVASVPCYKKLSGYYQKAPLPPEQEYSTGRKKKGKQMREVVTLCQIPSGTVRYYAQANNVGGLRGRSSGSPTPHTNSPRARTPQAPNSYTKTYPHRGMGRSNSSYRNTHSPAREGFPTFPNVVNVDMTVDGIWAVRSNANQVNHHTTSSLQKPFCQPLLHPPSMSEDGSQVQIRDVTLEALQQVMSAGGQQEVRVTGQRLEVISGEKHGNSQCVPGIEDNPAQFDNTSTPKAEERVNGTGTDRSSEDFSPSPATDNLQVQPLNQPPSLNTANGEVIQAPPPPLQPEPTITYISPPPIPPSQMGCTPSPHGHVYTFSCPPPYPSPGIVQVFSPIPPTDGTNSPSEYSSPPTSTTTAATPIPVSQSDGWDPSAQGVESVDHMKMNQGIPPYMVYHVPMMYGGYGGYPYNQQWGYPVPVMPAPTVEDNKQSPNTGSEGYPQMITVSGWGPGYMGEVMPQHPPVPGPLPPPPQQQQQQPQAYEVMREPVPLPYPPPNFQQQPEVRDGGRERPFHPQHHPRGRGRGGPHHYGQHRGGYHNHLQQQYNHPGSFQDGGGNYYGRGGGPQRSVPPRFQRVGGGPSNRGGPRHYYHQNSGGGPPHHFHPHQHHNNPPSHHHHRTQYEGQPLMHMGSRKSSSDSGASQVASGGSVGSGGLASPPLMTYVESDRPHPQGMLPLPPPDTPGMTQESMQAPGFFAGPPGYVYTGPWMWKMM